MLRWVVVVTVLSACDPGVCGHISINGIAMDPQIESYRQADGTIRLAELCGTDYGAFSLDRADLQMTTITFSVNSEDADQDDDATIEGVILPAASVAFWDAHLVKGATIPFTQLAGSGIHKISEGATYDIYPLVAGTITVISGPNDRDT